MQEIKITDVLQLLGIRYPENKSNFYIKCPCCDDDNTSGRGHLNINVKGVFRCPRCGVSGGIRDLYSIFANIGKEEAFAEIRKKLGSNYIPKQNTVTVVEYPMNDINTRNKTYTDLLDMLDLSPAHREALRRRGLTDEQIDAFGYKTAPLVNHFFLANKLQEKGDYLSGVPGFYKSKKGYWTFAKTPAGILIPVRDHKGRIQGLQIRLDEGETNRKYRWISSSDRKDGCKAKSFVHLVGENFANNPLVITEGPLKADIAHTYLGVNVLAVAGVNSVKSLKNVLKFLNPSKVITAFDMDYQHNPHVKEAMEKLYDILEEVSIPYTTYTWNEEYKGIDDFLVARKRKKAMIS